jgi:hypothetical protein
VKITTIGRSLLQGIGLTFTYLWLAFSVFLAASAEPVVRQKTDLFIPAAFTSNKDTWFPDKTTLSGIGSLGALIISLVALVLSQQSQTSQQLREKREELRAILERLIELRDEYLTVKKIADDTEKGLFLSQMYSKQMVYLEAAESIVKQIPMQISASEYVVMGNEFTSNSDYLRARKYYQLGTMHSSGSSPVIQSLAWRLLASSYFNPDPSLLNVHKGDEFYQRAFDALKDENDYYSLYNKSLVCVGWANSIVMHDMHRAGVLLDEAYQYWTKIPLECGLQRGPDYVGLAFAWLRVADLSCSNQLPEDVDHGTTSQLAYKKAEEIILALHNYGIDADYTKDALGRVYVSWGRSLLNTSCREEGISILKKARGLYLDISDAFPAKNIQSQYVESLISS